MARIALSLYPSGCRSALWDDTPTRCSQESPQLAPVRKLMVRSCLIKRKARSAYDRFMLGLCTIQGCVCPMHGISQRRSVIVCDQPRSGYNRSGHGIKVTVCSWQPAIRAGLMIDKPTFPPEPEPFHARMRLSIHRTIGANAIYTRLKEHLP